MGMLAERLDSGPSAVRSIKMAVFRATSYTAAPPKPKHVDVSRKSEQLENTACMFSRDTQKMAWDALGTLFIAFSLYY